LDPQTADVINTEQDEGLEGENPVTIERISLLKVPLDIVPQEQLPDIIINLL